ncbi:MAG: hypothetical protein ACKOTF_15350 [Opitutaceae bacterium]
MQNFDRLQNRLADSGLDFVIIGGFAAVSFAKLGGQVGGRFGG